MKRCRSRSRFLPLLVVLAAAACPSHINRPGDAAGDPSSIQGEREEWLADTLREAALRAFVPRSVATSMHGDRAEVICLGIGMTMHFWELPEGEVIAAPPRLGELVDPAPPMLSRLAQWDRRSRPVSSCAVADRPSGNRVDVRERSTGAGGLIVWVRDLTIQRVEGAISASILGGYHENGLSAAEWRCHLERRNDSWAMTDCEMQWIS